MTRNFALPWKILHCHIGEKGDGEFRDIRVYQASIRYTR